MANHDVGSAGPTFNVVFRKFLGLRADERSAEENALLESMQPVVTSHNGTPSTSYTWFDVRAKFGQNSSIDQLQAWWTGHRTRLNNAQLLQLPAPRHVWLSKLPLQKLLQHLPFKADMCGTQTERRQMRKGSSLTASEQEAAKEAKEGM